jgi:putative PIN family toxin of toxin-antitoxin system
MRAVVDASVPVRAIIHPAGTVGPVLGALRDARYVILYSEPLLAELVDVLRRPRIRDKYGIYDEDVETVLALILLRGELVIPDEAITACRDPKDDALLEVAVAGRADVIVTGDEDLLVLHPFRGIGIVGPARFMENLESGPDL